MKRLLPIVALILSGSTAFAEDPDLVEGARRAIAYWHSLFLQCGNTQGQGVAWYSQIPAGPTAGSIQMVPALRIQFNTEELTEQERLNGFEFKATTSLASGPFRWWSMPNKTWRDWEVGEIRAPRILIKKKGVWSDEAPPNRIGGGKPLTTCSEVPPMEDKR
jgi:hypothetical protein